MVEKCGREFEAHLTSDLVQLVFTCLSHTNHFVRETGYRVIAAIITIPGQCVCGVCVCVCVYVCVCVFCVSMCFCDSLLSFSGLSNDSVCTFWPDMAKNLARGLSDNWSQVQYTHMCMVLSIHNTSMFV